MESERSILLQKKMMLAMSLIIITVFSAIYVEKKKTVETYENANLIEIPEALTVALQEENLENETDFKRAVETVKTQYLMTKLVANNIVEEAIREEKEVGTHEDEIVEKNSVVEENHLENEIAIPKEEVPSQGETLFAQTSDEAESIEEEKSPEEIIEMASEIETVEEVTTVETPLEEEKATIDGKEYQDVIEVTATAYCLCQKCCGKTPDHPDYGYTASGLKIVPGTGMKVIAVDPKVIPLKSYVYVEGMNGAWDYGYAIAADTGGAIKNQKIDLYMDSHSEALKWGRRLVKVYVLKDEA